MYTISSWTQGLTSDKAKRISRDAQAKAWKDFKNKYPYANISKFEAETEFIDQSGKKSANADILFKAGPGYLKSVSGSERKYWSNEMKNALGVGGFPVGLIFNNSSRSEAEGLA